MAREIFGHCYDGVNYAVPPHELPATALADARNIVPDRAGLPIGRGGSVKLNGSSLSSRVTSFHEFRSGSTRTQLCSYSTNIASYSASSGDFSDEITGLTSDKMMQWVNFGGKAICVNEGEDPAQYYDASASGLLCATAPSGLCIAEWSHRLWFMDGATLKGSQLSDPTADYTDTGAADTAVSQTIGDSGDYGTGLFGFFDMLLIGKMNQLYKVTGNPSTDATTLSIIPLYTKSADSVGFTSQWAITQVGNDLIFLDGTDIKKLSGIEQYGDIETASIIPHCRDYLASIADTDYLKYTQFFHYKRKQQIWVSLPTSATERFVFVLDYKFLFETGRYAFFPMYNLDAICFGGVEDGQVTDIYMGDGTGFVWHLDTGNDDDASAIDRYFVKVFAGGDHGYRKDFQRFDNYIYPSTSSLAMTPYYAGDLMDDSDVRTSTNYTALDEEDITDWVGTGVKRKKIKLFGLAGNSLALKWRHNTAGENFVFQPSFVEFNWKGKTDIV